MLGNDIIDTALTRESTDWTRSGWLDKVCSLEEQDVILRSHDPFSTVWRIWSMKESAYKVNIQKGFEHAFNPSYFETQILNNIDGKVRFGDMVLETITEFTEDYIHTAAAQRYNGLPAIHTGIVADLHNLKRSLREQISESYSIPLEDVEIQYTDKRVPYIYNTKNQKVSPVSISHHGNYGAYTFYKHTGI